MPLRGRVIAVSSLALEARIALGPGVLVICNQGAELVAALEAAIERGAAGVISFGIAGGLAPDLAAGDWIVGAGVRHGDDRFAADPAWARRLLAALPGALHADVIGVADPVWSSADKRRLHAETGAVAVDTESHIAARMAAARRIPFVVCRAVIDAAHRDLPPAAKVGLRHDGRPDVPAVFRSVVQQPGQLPTLVRTALDARLARNALRRGRHRLGAGFGFPYFNAASLADYAEAAEVDSALPQLLR
jgi:hopanoid-associated phosphorylase